MTYAFEDFEIGSAVTLGAHTFTREEIVGFAERYDPQPFHLSEAAGEASHFGGLVASGWNTCSAMMGILVRDMLRGSTSMGSPGLDNIRWIKPVRVGDSVRLTVRVLDKRVSKSKPDRGIVQTRWEAHNQNGELVLTVDSAALFGLRNPVDSGASAA
ncbi:MULTISPECIES: MaoC family dehydratase [unclassified Caballeronia]|jgi:acyl dehydratase|uniref:MaoC family dehydratase n=1 Tax=unclassified Caballeronia TaxID=2646786 RepID=UPI0020293E63|nr:MULTISPECIES: MaoC family dehydratase [unclassified Caballeronia]MDR5787048.1 MaoC family dehydratase [Caballeronia sp. LP003]MDR5793335.1 MaoC family dehydratase [Caballeronia sp. LZ008]